MSALASRPQVMPSAISCAGAVSLFTTGASFLNLTNLTTANLLGQTQTFDITATDIFIEAATDAILRLPQPKGRGSLSIDPERTVEESNIATMAADAYIARTLKQQTTDIIEVCVTEAIAHRAAAFSSSAKQSLATELKPAETESDKTNAPVTPASDAVSEDILPVSMSLTSTALPCQPKADPRLPAGGQAHRNTVIPHDQALMRTGTLPPQTSIGSGTGPKERGQFPYKATVTPQEQTLTEAKSSATQPAQQTHNPSRRADERSVKTGNIPPWDVGPAILRQTQCGKKSQKKEGSSKIGLSSPNALACLPAGRSGDLVLLKTAWIPAGVYPRSNSTTPLSSMKTNLGSGTGPIKRGQSPYIATVSENNNGDTNTELVIVEGSFRQTPVREYYYVDRLGRTTFAGYEEVSNTGPALPEYPVTVTNLGSWTVPTERGQSPYQNGGLRVFGLGLPGGEAAFKQATFEDSETEAGQYLAHLLMAELAAGPDKAGEDKMRPAFNAYLQSNPSFGNGHSISQSDWQTYLQEIMRLAARHTPLFANSAIRGISAVKEDAARLLGIDQKTLVGWEEAKGLDVISAALEPSISPHFTTMDSAGTNARLMALLDGSMAEAAAAGLNIQNEEVISKAAETYLEWQMAHVSAIADTDAKVSSAVGLISDLHGSGRKRMAAKYMALIAMNSELNEEAAPPDPVTPRWTRDEFSALVQAMVMSEGWDTVSDRTFRKFLTVRGNRFVNLAINEAHIQRSIALVREVDVGSASDAEFWQRVDETGCADYILDRAMREMAENSRNLKLGSGLHLFT